MANAEHLALLKQGVDVWNKWRQKNEFVEPELGQAHLFREDLRHADLYAADLRKATLRRADLGEADLFRADLRDADLGEADLNWADLTWADLRGARLNRADLRGAHLRMADLRQADLAGTNLAWADFSGANLLAANLDGAELAETVFGNTNLTDAHGLDTCRHRGPSTIDHRTLTASGHLPLSFLRGCGLSEQFIEIVTSSVNQNTQFYSCFISYSTTDQAFAERLHSDLQNKGVRCWFAPHDIQAGKKIHEQIDEAIRLHDRLLLILSEHSMISEWVRTEIATARQRELREQRRMLFPVSLVSFQTVRDWKLFDADTGKDSAREIREYFIPDFSDWENDDHYQVAFLRLLKDLKAKEQ